MELTTISKSQRAFNYSELFEEIKKWETTGVTLVESLTIFCKRQLILQPKFENTSKKLKAVLLKNPSLVVLQKTDN